MTKKYFLFLLCATTFTFCAKPAPKTKEDAIVVKTVKTTLPLATRLSKYPFSESAKIELVALGISEFAAIEEKKARDSTNCSCKSVFAYPLKDVITKKVVLNEIQIDSLTAILFTSDTAKIRKGRGLTRIQNAVFFYDKNEKLFARLYIDTHKYETWALYKGKKEVDFVRASVEQHTDLNNFIEKNLK